MTLSADKAQRERFEEWVRSQGYIAESYKELAWGAWQAAFEAGRRERNEARDEDWREYITAVWMDPMLTGKKILKALIAGPPQPAPEAGDKRGAGEDGNG